MKAIVLIAGLSAVGATFTTFAQDATSNAIGEPLAREANISLDLPLQSSENFSFGQSPNPVLENLRRAS